MPSALGHSDTGLHMEDRQWVSFPHYGIKKVVTCWLKDSGRLERANKWGRHSFSHERWPRINVEQSREL